MKSEKGFTLTEILATLSILAIVIAIAVPSLNALVNKFESDYYENLEKTVLTSAKNYYKDRQDQRPVGILYSSAISIDGLKTEKYIDSAKAYKKEDDCSGYVVVVNEGNGNYNYKTCMVCDNKLRVSEDDKKYCAYTDTDNGVEENNSTDDVVYKLVYNNELEEGKDIFSTSTITNNSSFSTEFSFGGISLPVSSEFIMNDKWKKYIETKLSSNLKLEIVKDNEVLFKFDAGEGEDVSYKPLNISHISLAKNGLYTVNYISDNAEKKEGSVIVSQIGKPEIKDGKLIEPEIDFENWGKDIEKIPQKYDDTEKTWIDLKQIDNVNPANKYRYKYVETLNGIKYNFYSEESDAAKKFTLTLNYNCPSGNDGIDRCRVGQDKFEYSFGESLNIDNMFSITGYEFKGWFTKADDGEKWEGRTMPENDVTLYAHWETKKLTLKYDLNCDTNCDNLTKPENKTVAFKSSYDGLLPSVGEREGYTLVGWFIHKNGNEKQIKPTNNITYDDCDDNKSDTITLYAHWKKNIYTLKFNTNGANESIADMKVEYNSKLKDKISGYNYNTVTKNGHALRGWLDEDGNSIDNNTYMPAKNLTIKADWLILKYYLRFESLNDKCELTENNKYLDYNSKYGTLPKCKDDKYEIYGWYSCSNCFDKVTSDSRITAETTIYARSEQVKFNLTYYNNDGTNSSNTEIVKEGTTINLPNITRTGYTFEGWYTSSSGGSKVSSGTKMPSDDYNLYAHWKKNDSTSPTCNFSISGTKGQNNYYTSNVTISLNRYDDVGVTSYGLTTSSSSSYNGNASATLSSSATYYGYVKDSAGNTGRCSITINIDKTKPTIPTMTYHKDSYDGSSYTLGDWTNSTIYRKIKSSDNGGSGIARFEWSNDTSVCGTSNTSSNYGTEGFEGNPTTYYDNTYYKISYTPSSSNEVCYRAVDKAGNASNWTSVQTVKVDKKSPDVPTMTYHKGSYDGSSYTLGDWTNSTIYRKIKSSDNGGSGIARFEWSNNTSVCGSNNTPSNNYGTEGFEGNPTTYSDNTYYKISYTPSSSNEACYRAVDKAGNASNWTSVQDIKIDKTKPSISFCAKKLGIYIESDMNKTCSDLSDYSNYTSGESYSGGTVHLIVLKTDTDSGVKSISCSTSGAENKRNSSTFSYSRGFVREGKTTVTCNATDNAGNTASSSFTINNTHTHYFNTSIKSSKTIGSTTYPYKNYIISTYQYDTIKSNMTGKWTCTSTPSHTHSYNGSKTAALRACMKCGQAAREIDGNNHNAWWCPTAAKEIDSNVYG